MWSSRAENILGLNYDTGILTWILRFWYLIMILSQVYGSCTYTQTHTHIWVNVRMYTLHNRLMCTFAIIIPSWAQYYTSAVNVDFKMVLLLLFILQSLLPSFVNENEGENKYMVSATISSNGHFSDMTLLSAFYAKMRNWSQRHVCKKNLISFRKLVIDLSSNQTIFTVATLFVLDLSSLVLQASSKL